MIMCLNSLQKLLKDTDDYSFKITFLTVNILTSIQREFLLLHYQYAVEFILKAGTSKSESGLALFLR